jgi:hypothetical protein
MDSEQIAVITFFPDDGSHKTLIVRQWQPGCGSGDRPEAWCLGESFSSFKISLSDAIGFPTGICEDDESIEQVPSGIRPVLMVQSFDRSHRWGTHDSSF